MNFCKRANEMKSQLVEVRRHLHQIPEIGDNLPITTEYVMNYLKKLGLEPEEICSSGIVATIYGGKPGKTMMLRADMDALPMNENNDFPFKSTIENQAHNCGHDLHTTMLLGAAEMLVEHKEDLCGNVKLMFQPAEEVFTGAAAMLKGGLMENPHVDAAFDMHVMTDMPYGTISTNSGFITASCDGFKIFIKGKACHGAQPQNGVDPINVAAHMHIALQELIARETPPSEIAVLTIGQLTAGSAPNIIPDMAMMQGTMRCYNKELRAKLNKRFKEVVEYTARAFGAEVEIETLSDVPSIYADPALMKECEGYIREMDCGLNYDEEYLVTPSDDFARVAELVPSTFFAVGAQPTDPAQVYPNHNPNVVFNEDCLPVGAAMFAQCAYRWLENNA